MIKLE